MKRKIIFLKCFIVVILIGNATSSQVVDPRLDKFLIVNEWTGNISVKINSTKDYIGTATVNGNANIVKSFNQGITLGWGTITSGNAPWNWDVHYNVDYRYEEGNCHMTGDGNNKFLAAIYINPLNYTYLFAFLEPNVPVTVKCPDTEDIEDVINLVYGLEVRHLKLDLDTLLLKGSITFTDIEAQRKDKEAFDSYKDSMENILDRNRILLENYDVNIPEVEGQPENNIADESNGITYEVSWDLVPKREVTQITLHEIDRSWYPSEAGTISTYVEWNEAVQPVAVRFTLFEITNEKGYCLNSREKHESLDITFDTVWASEHHFEFDDVEGEKNTMRATLRSLNLTGRQEVKINSYDYGGWAKLKVELMFENTWVPADNLPFITIPFDEDRDKIADKWEEEYGVQTLAPDWDEETGNGHTREGDGITLYEEYRGFFTLPGNTYKRTDPNVKDLFVIDPEGLFSPGVWEYTSGMQGSRVDNTMTKFEGGPKESRIVDFNDGYAKNNHKYALRIITNQTEGYKRGDENGVIVGFAPSNRGEHIVANAPKDCDSTIIYVGNIRAVTRSLTIRLGRMLNEFTDEQINNSAHITRNQCQDLYNILSNPSAMEAAIQYFIQATLFHEIGHGCSVHHHSGTQPNVGDYKCPMRYTDSYEDIMILEYTIINLLEFINSFQVVDVSGIAEKYKTLRFCDWRHNCYMQLCVKDD